MKVSKDFKNEFDQEFADGYYAAKKVYGKVALWFLILFLVLGAVGIGYRYIKVNSDRVIFKQSITYNEGMLDDLAKYMFQYDNAEDDIERESIATLVRNRFANFDQSKIENYELREFLEDCGL